MSSLQAPVKAEGPDVCLHSVISPSLLKLLVVQSNMWEIVVKISHTIVYVLEETFGHARGAWHSQGLLAPYMASSPP